MTTILSQSQCVKLQVMRVVSVFKQLRPLVLTKITYHLCLEVSRAVPEIDLGDY